MLPGLVSVTPLTLSLLTSPAVVKASVPSEAVVP